jgi:hypothetical protein
MAKPYQNPRWSARSGFAFACQHAASLCSAASQHFS